MRFHNLVRAEAQLTCNGDLITVETEDEFDTAEKQTAETVADRQLMNVFPAHRRIDRFAGLAFMMRFRRTAKAQKEESG
jgi:hypothetical protein